MTESPRNTMYAISITGMQLKNVFCYPKFFWYSVAALQGAESFPGNIAASTNACYMPNGNGESKHTLMTLTVWEDRKTTMKYVTSPAHLAAMKQMKNLGSYSKMYHYESDKIPTWEEAKQLWVENGKEYSTMN
jgi:heme-degrading monooxygenase HmoA